MKTEGVEAIFLTTHNWGRSANSSSPCHTLDFETDHNSGQLRNGPPPTFIAEVPADQAPAMQLVMKVADARAPADPGVEVVSPSRTPIGARRR